MKPHPYGYQRDVDHVIPEADSLYGLVSEFVEFAEMNLEDF
jgi:hypothetical protein